MSIKKEIIYKKQTTLAIIGIGSSQGNREEIMKKSCEEISLLGENFRVSSNYETQPWGGVAKNKFLNAVCSIQTLLDPIALLDSLQVIEKRYGRVREKKWADRTLDLDILYFGDLEMDTERLIIPHPLIQERDFVLNPLRELYPEKIKM